MSSEPDQPAIQPACFAAAAQSLIRLPEDQIRGKFQATRTFASSAPKRSVTGACKFLGDQLDAEAAAIDLSASGLDDRQEQWIAADACIAGREQPSCFGIVDAETSFHAATRTWPG